MRKAISKTEFVKFEVEGAQALLEWLRLRGLLTGAVAAASLECMLQAFVRCQGDDGPATAQEPAPAAKAPEKEEAALTPYAHT